MSDHSDRMEAAIQQALGSRGGNLLSIGLSYYSNLTASGYLKKCPFCEKGGQKFAIRRAKEGHWYWGCHNTSCRVSFDNLKAERSGDAIGFIQVHEGCDRNEAVDKFLAIAGVANPRDDLRDQDRKKEAKKRKSPQATVPGASLPQSVAGASLPQSVAGASLPQAVAGASLPQAVAGASCPEPTPKPEEQPPAPPAAQATVAGASLPQTVAGASLPQAVAGASCPEPAPKPAEQPPIASFDLEDVGSFDDAPPLKTSEATPTKPTPDPLSLTDTPTEETPEAPPNVWHLIWERLTLNAADREVLKRKRGQSRETIEELGFRSSIKENRQALDFLLTDVPFGLTAPEGIVTIDENTQEKKVAAQLCGLGLAKRGKNGEKDEWGWTHPILIPYLDRHGKVTFIRPHKGGLSGKNYMRKQGFELSFRASKTRTHPYPTPSFWNQPEGWQRRCVLTEGEFKAAALHQCGIPAIAVPGIQMPRNDHFLKELVDMLREAGIRDVIVCFDNEDTSHKPDPWDRHDVEVYAMWACFALRRQGFNTSMVDLPEDWRIDGKADWDGALATLGKKAPAAFKAVLKKAKPFYKQDELWGLNEKQRIVHCKFNRLCLEPKILTGGDEEEELAKLILKTPHAWRTGLPPISTLAQELFELRGCYYIKKAVPPPMAKPYVELLEAVQSELDSARFDDMETLAGLEAAKATILHVLYGRPKPLSDFTIQCEFQLRKQDGDVERLFRFKNKHGQTSDLISVPSSATCTSSRFREFAGRIGNFNPKIGDSELQELMQDLGTFSAWREIRELPMLGRDPESGLWIMGDCAFTKDGEVLFADDHHVIWHEGIGYRIDPTDLREFAHQHPPQFFQALGKEPSEVLAVIKEDPLLEAAETAKVFLQFATDLIFSFGDSSGLLALGVILSYPFAPDLISRYHGHPGLWLHGRAFSGKTETAAFFMQTAGFPKDYRTFVMSAGTTDVGIDRVLAQYCDIPTHIDEFRQDEADKKRIGSLRSPFNRQAKQKGRHDQTNRTRSVQPMTSPIVTGEGVTKDSATLSRYVEAILSADKRLGNHAEQKARYSRMLRDSKHYHRIFRWIYMNRPRLAAAFMETLETFLDGADSSEAIASDRVRLCYGVAYSAYLTIHNTLSAVTAEAAAAGKLGEVEMARTDIKFLTSNVDNLHAFTLDYAGRAAADVISINFLIQFWEDVMTANRRSNALSRFISFVWCRIDPDTNKVTITTATEDAPGLVRCVIVQPQALYAEYEQDCRSRGKEPTLSLSNIRSECQAQRYWVNGPKHVQNRSHRLSIGGKQQTVWVLRTDRMEPALENIFSDSFGLSDDEDPEPRFGI